MPLGDPAYGLLDRLLAELPVLESFHGQRPYTRRQFAAVVRGARALLRASGSPPPRASRGAPPREALLSALEERFLGELATLQGEEVGLPAVALDRVRVEGAASDSRFRGFTSNGLGRVDNARVSPLLDSRFGRELADGGTVALESEMRAHPSSWMAAFGEARMAYHRPRGGEEYLDLLVRRAGLRARLGGWALQAGRAEVRRGQGRRAGVVLSDHAPPLDVLLLESEDPFRFPWLSDLLLGPARFSVFLADLGADQNFPHATLYGNWLTFRPAPSLEVGGGFVVQSGGEGAPEQSFWDRVGDYFLFAARGTDLQASNKIAGVDFRYTLPGAGVVAYGEMYLDDFRVRSWRSVGETLWPDAAHVLGISLPRVHGSADLAAWIEYHHTGVRFYRHSDFTSGVTQERFLLGDPLGPDAQGIVGGLDLSFGPLSTVSLEAAWESRSHDQWTAFEDPVFHFVKVADGPEEERRRVRLIWDRRAVTQGVGWRLEAGAEQARGFGFERGRKETSAALILLLEWALG